MRSDPTQTELLSFVERKNDYVVIDKPAGLHSVPGKGPEKQDSVETRVRTVFPEATGPISIHRLDMETSGLIVAALTKDAHRAIMRQFMHRKVGKSYTAVLDGVPEVDSGEVDLPLAVDWERRPRQRVDHEKGRRARTLWRILERRDDGTSRVEFRPETGRTHQLRVHAATPVDDGGIGAPILGDTLYGDPTRAPRLMLHASFLAFWEPGTGNWVKYTSKPEF